MRKGVAIPYVIALVLGVAVVGLLGFWFVMTGGKLGQQSVETECQNAISIYCSKLLISGVPATLDDDGACARTGITPPGSFANCKAQGYIS
ncbi:MAG: hypothetical protein HYS80_01625 [Candidatus Aenigmarchaeota archaeon]|nr:hypothetical protein [Candidatus Aenigmarchaeota archaeon]